MVFIETNPKTQDLSPPQNHHLQANPEQMQPTLLEAAHRHRSGPSKPYHHELPTIAGKIAPRHVSMSQA
jgi:hypothetical protein